MPWLLRMLSPPVFTSVYDAIWLNGTERGWGIAYRATGALVVTDDGLLIGLTQPEAETLVATLAPEAVILPEGFARRPVIEINRKPLGRRR